MAVNPTDSQGTTISVDGVLVGGVKSIGGLGSGSPSERDRSTLDDRKFKRIGMGLRDGGTVTLQILLDPSDAGQRKLNRYWRDATRGAFVVTLVSGSTRSFYGYVMTFAEEFAADSDVMSSCQLRVDGEITGFPDPS